MGFLDLNNAKLMQKQHEALSEEIEKEEMLQEDRPTHFVEETAEESSTVVVAKGSVIDVEITSCNKDGISVKTDNGLPGFIYKNQISWMAEPYFPKRGDSVRVCVKKYDAERQTFYASIKDLSKKPFCKFQHGSIVKGYVMAGSKGNYWVTALDYAVKCEDDARLPLWTEMDFYVIESDETTEKITLSHTLVELIKDFEQFFVNFFKNTAKPRCYEMLSGGKILFAQNILYKGNPMALPFSLYFLEKIRNKPSLLKPNCCKNIPQKVKGIYSLLTIDVAEVFGPELSVLEKLYAGNWPSISSCSHLVTEMQTQSVCNTLGLFCVVDKDMALSEQQLLLPTKKKSPFLFLKANATKADANVNESFLSDKEKEVCSEADIALVDKMLEENPQISRRDIDTYKGVIYLCYNNSLVEQFNEQNPECLIGRKLWLTFSENEKEKRARIKIFDDNLYIECIATNHLDIQKFDFGKKNTINRGKTNKALIVAGENVKLVKFYDCPASFDTDTCTSNIRRQFYVWTSLLPKIKKNLKGIKEKIGHEYLLVNKFLEFQQQREEDSRELKELDINGNDVELGTTDSNSMGLVINNWQCRNLLKNDEQVCVKVFLDVSDQGLFGKLSDYEDGKFFLEIGQHLDLSQYKQGGFHMEFHADTRHIRLQQKNIQEFVYRNELLNKLHEGTLESPEEKLQMKFFDDKFNHVEEGNNQPSAIRKAAGNKDIFLIQGPPGTGKTSVIVEIIRQLINKNEKVLVCSQAHSAVKNIYDRLIVASPETNVGFLDDDATMRAIKQDDYLAFLQNNQILLDAIKRGKDVEEDIKNYVGLYGEYVREDFERQHRCVSDIVKDQDSIYGIKALLEEYREQVEKQEDRNLFLSTAHINSLQVVMGTCVGVGMNKSLYKSGVKFDTLIIDEAGKANMAETVVPMSMADKFILVGDQNQLPPYTDSEETREFADKENIEQKEVDNILGTSLFEDFLLDKNYRPENKILLNFQYRMNSKLGDYISRLFYGGKLKNGNGTGTQECVMDGYPEVVVFEDTSKRKDCYEKHSGNDIYNDAEIELVCKDMRKGLENLMSEGHSVGIISPYNGQVRRIRKELSKQGSVLSKNVYTIDSVQGLEFDVVVISFVRAMKFEKGKYQTVGFLDNLRRLNVALSRAKKKLIMVGHLDTLRKDCFHRKFANGTEQQQPAYIFQKMSENTVKHSRLNSVDKLRKANVKVGQLFKDCEIVKGKTTKDGKVCPVRIMLGSEKLQFNVPMFMLKPNMESGLVDLRYVGDGDDGRPRFQSESYYQRDLFIKNHHVGDIVRCTVTGQSERHFDVICEEAEGIIVKIPNKSYEFVKIGASYQCQIYEIKNTIKFNLKTKKR